MKLKKIFYFVVLFLIGICAFPKLANATQIPQIDDNGFKAQIASEYTTFSPRRYEERVPNVAFVCDLLVNGNWERSWSNVQSWTTISFNNGCRTSEAPYDEKFYYEGAGTGKLYKRTYYIQYYYKTW